MQVAIYNDRYNKYLTEKHSTLPLKEVPILVNNKYPGSYRIMWYKKPNENNGQIIINSRYRVRFYSWSNHFAWEMDYRTISYRRNGTGLMVVIIPAIREVVKTLLQREIRSEIFVMGNSKNCAELYKAWGDLVIGTSYAYQLLKTGIIFKHLKGHKNLAYNATP